MHIHGNSMNVNSANLYSAAQGEKAAAAQKAAEVRKRLLKSAAKIEDQPSSNEDFLISRWMDSRHGQV
jgi:hypothetical protein